MKQRRSIGLLRNWKSVSLSTLVGFVFVGGLGAVPFMQASHLKVLSTSTVWDIRTLPDTSIATLIDNHRNRKHREKLSHYECLSAQVSGQTAITRAETTKWVSPLYLVSVSGASAVMLENVPTPPTEPVLRCNDFEVRALPERSGAVHISSASER